MKSNRSHPAPTSCPRQLSRRRFLRALGASAAWLLAAGCQYDPFRAATPTVPPVNPAVKPADVAIAQAADYDPKLIRQQVETLLDSLGGLSDIVRSGDRVAIKVNLTGGTGVRPLPGVPAIESFATHPQVVQALGELLRDAGASEIYIVEAVYQWRSYTQWGYQAVADALDATLIDLNAPDPYPDFATTPVGDGWFIYPEFFFNRILEEVDAFISLAKMKCHWSCGVTHSLKNLIGLVPAQFYHLKASDNNRSAFHGNGDEFKTRLPRIVLDLNRARPIHLALIDGVKTVEGGEGPWFDIQPVEPGVLIAGKDPVAADAAATAVMGFDPLAEAPTAPFLRADNHLNLAYQLGLGNNRLSAIHVLGEAIADVVHPFAPAV